MSDTDWISYWIITVIVLGVIGFLCWLEER